MEILNQTTEFTDGTIKFTLLFLVSKRTNMKRKQIEQWVNRYIREHSLNNMYWSNNK